MILAMDEFRCPGCHRGYGSRRRVVVCIADHVRNAHAHDRLETVLFIGALALLLAVAAALVLV